MTAAEDIDALIRRADDEIRRVEKDKRGDFAGVTAMAGLTILARHIDALAVKIDGPAADRTEGTVDVRTELADLRRRIEKVADDLERGGQGPG
jgi:enoyl reductase-like protein